jgi:nucleoside-diphosphate-sugar epimerase
MNVLVTGAAGFLGSVLVPLLLERGFTVKALDKFYFGTDPFKALRGNKSLEIIDADTRFLDPAVLKDVDAVIDLAAVAQTDPENILPPVLFYDMNVLGALRVASLSASASVKRYIYASTTSVYGVRDDIATEDSPVDPVEIYARTKYLAEQSILKLADNHFCVTALRFATLYGYSPRMRFDLLLNRMVLSAYQGKILVGGDGEQQRVILHVKDAANAVTRVLDMEENRIRGEIFNIGDNRQNFKIIELARIIKSVFPEREFEYYGDPDRRSFRVNFDKAERVLQFRANYTPAVAVAELRARLEGGIMPQERDFDIPWWLKLSQEENNPAV